MSGLNVGVFLGAELWAFLVADPTGHPFGTIGIAYVGVVCTSSQSYKTSLTEYRTSNPVTAVVRTRSEARFFCEQDLLLIHTILFL